MKQRNDATGRESALSMDADTFRELGRRIVDRLADRLGALPDGPVVRAMPPSAVRDALGLGGALPEDGADPLTLGVDLVDRLFDASLFNGHPRFFGYITAAPAPIGMLADLIAAAVNPNVGAWRLSPAASEIEAEAVRWIAEFIGYPGDCGGLFVSGGNLANLVCFWAARAAKAGWDVQAGGMTHPDARPLRVYGSRETHTWIQKAADLSGIGTDAVRWIDTDRGQRLDVEALRVAIDADRRDGAHPFMVVGTAGSVSTGAVDPLPEIADLCEELGLWFHVDGAYGGFAAAVPEAPDDLRALRRADSVAVDPHKWLYAPLEAGCGLVRDRDALRRAFSYHPPYYHFEEPAVNYVDYGLQNSRGFRALKVWLALRHAGAAGYRRMISDDIGLSRRMFEAVAADPELEAFTQALSIATFRFVPLDLRERVGEADVEAYLDLLNQEVLDRHQLAGRVFVSNAVLDDRYVLRACIVNFHTDAPDVDRVPSEISAVGRAVDSELRPSDLRARA